jgi:protein-S-isoprenylcysteine O-methyltransferase Ste14
VGLALHPILGLVATVATAIAARRIHARRVRPIDKGMQGEQLVTDLLARLPANFFLVNDVVLPGTSGNVDHIVIGSCGVVVIETKHWAGTVLAFRDMWVVNGRVRKSVAKQADQNAIAVRNFLASRHPDLPGSLLRFVDAVVVLTNPLCRVKVHWARSTTTVVRYSQLLQLIFEKAGQRQMPGALAARLAGTLALHSSPSDPTLRPS